MSGDERSRERPQDPAAVAARALAYLRAEGALRTIDGEFAALLRRRFDTDPLVALAGALAMRAVALGHSGFALARADDLLAALAVRTTLPPLEAWQAALRASPLVECTAVSGGGVEGAARESAAVENAAVESAALEGAALEGAALEGAALEGAALEGAALEGAALESASVEAMPQRDNAAPSAHAPSHAQKPTLLAFEYGRVSLRRYARYEQALAEALFARGIHGVDASNASDAAIADTLGAARDANAESSLAATLRKLFALSNDNAAFDRQAFAAWRSLQRRLLLITGGPGTGKTTTVARLLALHIAAADARGEPQPRVALAAPTGRAAVRLAEAIAARVAQDLAEGRIDAALAARIPRSAQTLHRLLGPRPGRTGFRHHAAHPLPFDLVVVDEASMIDLPLMAKLVAAVAPQARLILLGDPDQLPAVEAGDVLGGLCAAAGEALALDTSECATATRVFGASLRDVLAGEPRAERQAISIAATADAVPPLAGNRVHLLRGWRQADAHALQAMTEAVRDGDDNAALAKLDAGDPALQWRHGDPLALGDWLREAVLPNFFALRDAGDPAAALRMAQRMRMLTALRRGPFGAEFWNLWCAAELGARDAQFHGRLIAIAENSARHGLYNGDLGVLWRDRDNGLAAWFETGGQLRAWRPGQLPAHVTAFATTVHKAQGSEFDAVALLLPDADTRALSRELLYTALTRARQRILLWAAQATLRRALERRTHRDSGLLSRLQVLGRGPRAISGRDVHPQGDN
jgi:exodeoxyribonuclease V alpha subunit